jgi:hypothetical protein
MARMASPRLGRLRRTSRVIGCDDDAPQDDPARLRLLCLWPPLALDDQGFDRLHRGVRVRHLGLLSLAAVLAADPDLLRRRGELPERSIRPVRCSRSPCPARRAGPLCRLVDVAAAGVADDRDRFLALEVRRRPPARVAPVVEIRRAPLRGRDGGSSRRPFRFRNRPAAAHPRRQTVRRWISSDHALRTRPAHGALRQHSHDKRHRRRPDLATARSSRVVLAA